MWQVLVAAAAAAGSAILAKKLNTEKSFSGFSPNDQEHAQDIIFQSQDSIFHSTEDSTIRVKSEPLSNEGEIFRFSSLESRSSEFKKSNASGLKRVKKNIISKKRKKIGSSTNGGKGKGVDQRAYASGKRVSVCLKKRRTSKFVAGNCESCAYKDNSFNWGVGIGIMYMMSAGKAEIDRLNFAVDETSKLVQEIKSEISRNKPSSSCEPHISVAEDDSETNEIGCTKSYNGQGFANIDTKGKNKLKRYQHPSNQDGECAGSFLTEDQHQQPDVLEIDQLQAELEVELQKLPWCATESSGSEGRNDIFKAEDFAKDHQHGYSEDLSLYPVNGVSPVELNQKLSCLLIEQQENQIVELESELHQAHRQLHEKEAELKALRDCVKSLTQLSLGDASDEETEDARKTSSVEEELGFDSTESMAGVKRSLDCESNACFTI